MKITEEFFGKHPEGKDIYSYILENDKGVTIKIINYGGIITHLYTPDIQDNVDDIVLGFNNLEDYLGKHPYFGAIIGRYCNRIALGQFTIDGKNYKLAVNSGVNHLHGGITGFDKKVWTAQKFSNMEEVGVKLALESPDGDEGYPGNLLVEAEYALNNKNEFYIRFSAKTDKTTHINLTNHSYFNLSACKKDILEHRLSIEADHYTETGENMITTGKLLPVFNSPLDFRVLKIIGQDIDQIPPGFDHNFVLNKKNSDEIKLAARLEDPQTGRVMETFTTQPGLQFYSANFLDEVKGKHKVQYNKHMALCLETQHFPNTPNIPGFPSTLLYPDKKYQQVIMYRFSTLK